MIKEKYYYAKVDYGFINYLFRKDLTYMRLPDTKLLKNTITYNSKQIKVLRKLHPDLKTLSYGMATDELKFMPKPIRYKQTDNQIDSIIKYLS